MRVLLTGATSFTGAHIARAFRDAGFDVAATLTKRMIHYSDPLIQRRRAFSRIEEWIEEAPFGSKRMIDALRSSRADIFVNHGADIRGYRSPDFDYLSSVRASLDNARELVETLAAAGCSRFIHSGSVFEPDEGEAALVPAPSAEAVSIYGVSKALVWQPLRFFCGRANLPVSKIVIANPVGPLENPDRLIPFFVKTWKSNGVPALRTPQLVRDNVPAPWLARFYVEEASLKKGAASLRVRRPSAYALSNESFLRVFVKNFQARLNDRNFAFEVNPLPADEPMKRVNVDRTPELTDPGAEARFWDEWVESTRPWL